MKKKIPKQPRSKTPLVEALVKMSNGASGKYPHAPAKRLKR